MFKKLIKYKDLLWWVRNDVVEQNRLLDSTDVAFLFDLRCLKCHCILKKVEEKKYQCLRCNNKEYTLDREYNDYIADLNLIVSSYDYEGIEVLNLDNELTPIIPKERDESDDYWVEVKLTKDKSENVSAVVYFGSKKENDKAQMFVDVKNERLGFDQNNLHPNHVLAKVEATFKNSSTCMQGR